jgi:hypothetical protein
MFRLAVRLQGHVLSEPVPAHLAPVRRLVGVLPRVRFQRVRTGKSPFAEVANVRSQLEVFHFDMFVQELPAEEPLPASVTIVGWLP